MREWSKKAKEISDGGGGVDHILGVSGAKRLKQSFEALAFGGSFALIGFLVRDEKDDDKSKIDGDDVSMLALQKNATIRGIVIGSVGQLNNM